MKNIKGYTEHIRESKPRDLEIKYDYWDAGSTNLFQTPWQPFDKSVPREIGLEAKRIILDRGLPGDSSIWTFQNDGPYDWSISIFFTTDAGKPTENVDFRVEFVPFQGKGPDKTLDLMSTYLWKYDQMSWKNTGKIPFGVNELGRVLTEISGKYLDDITPNAEALVLVIMDALDKISLLPELSGDKLNKRRRSRGAFGRF
jgi:hypothetical protein